MNPESKLCFDTMGKREYGKVSLFNCHGIGGNQVREREREGEGRITILLQEFGFSDSGEIVFDDDLCLDVSSKERGGKVGILNCHGLGGNQKWEYNNVVSLTMMWSVDIISFCMIDSFTSTRGN